MSDRPLGGYYQVRTLKAESTSELSFQLIQVKKSWRLKVRCNNAKASFEQINCSMQC